MPHTPFKVGEKATHEEMRIAYDVSVSGGMRWSSKRKCLVIISGNSDGLYNDRWDEDKLFYTGEGQKGNQTLTKQNKRLADSRKVSTEIHLFETNIPNEYIYRGQVELFDDPFQEKQMDKDKKMRDVWVFPLKLLEGAPAVDDAELQRISQKKKREVAKLTSKQLEEAAKALKGKKPGKRKNTTTTYDRSDIVIEYVKLKAKGKCMLCGKKAPFIDKKGTPFLEVHHIVWLSKGGADAPENAVALCPNCHRKMHNLAHKDDIKRLKEIAEKNAK